MALCLLVYAKTDSLPYLGETNEERKKYEFKKVYQNRKFWERERGSDFEQILKQIKCLRIDTVFPFFMFFFFKFLFKIQNLFEFSCLFIVLLHF